MLIDAPTILKIENLTTDGLVTTTNGDGTLSIAPTAVRPILSANQTYYVRTDGNDSNDGSANDAAHAFLTIQHAVDVATYPDLNGFTTTIQIADGTYTENISIASKVSNGGSLKLSGNAATPSNVVLTSNSGTTINITNCPTYTKVLLYDFKIQCASAGYCVFIGRNTSAAVSGVNFGTSTGGTHIRSSQGGSINFVGNYAISGGAARHFYASYVGVIDVTGAITCTLTGTPAFSSQFILSTNHGEVVGNSANQITWSGAATGSRYTVNMNSFIGTTGSTTYFPGDTAGTLVTGGQYT